MLKKVLLFVVAAVGLCAAQGQRIGVATTNVAGALHPAPGASVKVCSYNAQLQCSSPISIYSDSGLSFALPNPFNADKNGNYQYYAANGTYLEQVCTPAGGCFTQPVSFTQGGNFSTPPPLGNGTPNTVYSTDSIPKATPAIDIRAYGALCDGSTDDSTAIQSAINAAETAVGNNENATVTGPPGKTCLFGTTLNVIASGTGNISIGADSGPSLSSGAGMVWVSTGGAQVIVNPSVLGEGIGVRFHGFTLKCNVDGTSTSTCPSLIQIGTSGGTNSSTFGPIYVDHMTLEGNHNANSGTGSYGAVSAFQCAKSCGLQINITDSNLEDFSGPIVDLQTGCQNVVVSHNQFFDAPSAVAVSSCGTFVADGNYIELVTHEFEVNNKAYWNIGTYAFLNNLSDLSLIPPANGTSNTGAQRCLYVTNQDGAANITAKITWENNICNESTGFVSGGVGLAPYGIDVELTSTPNGLIYVDARDNVFGGMTTSGIYGTAAGSSLTYVGDWNNHTTAVYHPDYQGATFLPNVTGSVRTIPSTEIDIGATNAATNGNNYGSFSLNWIGNYWNGSYSTPDIWTETASLGTGTTPSTSLVFSHQGSSGQAIVYFPSIGSTATLNRSIAGWAHLGHTDTLGWRNYANSSDLVLGPDASNDYLSYAGHDFLDSAGNLYVGAAQVPTETSSTPLAGAIACVKAAGPPMVIGSCTSALSGTPPFCTCN